MSKWTIYALDGSVRAVTDTLELHDEWMAECFVTLTINSALPIDFEVGDYLDYRGDRYTINYDPTVIKKARRGAHGEGFVYDNIKFVSVQDEIVRCDFSDLVLADNNIHYTSLPTFPFFCETVDDLLDRIQACLEELYPGRWTLVSPDFNRTRQRGLVLGRLEDFVNAYYKYIGEGSEFTYEKTGVALTADNITCWDALKYVNDYFDLNFIVRGFCVVVGTAGVFTPRTFRYGKGNGLYEIERISDSEQRIVTRLRAYGSEENLPSRYYANLNSRIYGITTREEEGIANLDVAFRKDYFTNGFSSGETDIKVEIGGTTYESKAYNNAETGAIIVNTQSMDVIPAGTKVYMVSGVKEDAWPDDHREYNGKNLPDNMAVSRLMLPGFPKQSLHSWVMAHRGQEGYEYLDEMIEAGIEFSTDKYRPYIDSPNKSIYDIRPASIYFDGSDETDNIHPTIEGMDNRGVPIDEIYSAETIKDNGVFGEGEIPNFTITLPDLGFDLGDVYQDGAAIEMKDGMCGGRKFDMASKPTQNDSGQLECRVKRSHDTSLDLYFPYSDFQIRNGDHYVLTGIYLPDAYVDKASERLLKAAYDALLKNHAPRFTFQPRIDEIWMARQHDISVQSGGATPSLHDTLKAGDIFVFEDEDLGIDARIIIDILTIKENGNNGIPTYEVTLRNEKVVSTIEKTISKVESAISSGLGGGGGYSTRQIGSLIELEGSDLFLSKVEDDEAQGVIGFLKGVWFGIRDWYIDATGNANLNDVVANGILRAYSAIINRVKSSNFSGFGMLDSGWQIINDYEGQDSYAVFDRLYIRKKAIFEELELRKISHIGGNFCLSPASGRVWRVECYDSEVGGELLGYDTYTVPYTLGGRVLALFSHSLANRFLSRKRKLARQLTPEEIARVKRIRVYMFSDDGTTKTMQNWTVGAQARCQTFNIETQMDHISGGESDNPDVDYWTGKKVQNTYWWRMVYAVGEAECEDGKKHAYIEFLENQTNQRTHSDIGSDIPSVGDEFGQFGHRTEPTQQNVIMIETANPDSPSMKFYKGVNSWSVENKRKTVLSPAGTEIYSQRYHIETEYDDVLVPMDRGEWQSGMECHYYDRVSHNGSLWLCIVIDGSSTTEEPSETSTVWMKQVAKGDKGETSFKSNVFKRSASKPSKPTGGSFSSPVPSGWSDGIPSGTDSIWVSTRVFSSDGQPPQQDAWTDVQLMSDTESFDVEFAKEQAGGGQPALPNGHNQHGGDQTQVWFDPSLDSSTDFTTMIWMAERTKIGGVWGAWKITKIKGEKGTDATTTALKYTGPLAEGATAPTINTYKQFTWTDNIPTQTEAKPNVYVGVWRYTAGTTLDINSTPPTQITLFAHYGKTGSDGADGDDGKNGTSIVAAPNAIVINQQRVSTGGAQPLTNISYPIVVVARDSGTIVKSTVSNLTTTNCTASITKNNVTDSTVTITAISKYTEGGKEKYRTSGAVAFHVTAQTAKGDTFQADISVPFGCNLLGQYTLDIEEDVKTEVSSKVTSEIDSRNLVNVTTMNTTVQQSAAGLKTEIKKVDDRLNAGGDIATSITNTNTRVDTADSSIQTLNSQMAGDTASGLNTKITNTNSRVSTAESDISTLKTTTSSQGTSITNLNTRMSTAEGNITTVSKQVSGTAIDLGNADSWEQGSTNEQQGKTYDQIKTESDSRIRTTRLFAVSKGATQTFTAATGGYSVGLAFFDSNKLCTGGWSGYTALTLNTKTSRYEAAILIPSGVSYAAAVLADANTTTVPATIGLSLVPTDVATESYVKQEADSVRVGIVDDLGDTGIDIENGTIKLKGNNVTFTNSAGTASGKIWIDPSNGTLHATDGDFSGYVNASSGKIGALSIGYNTDGDTRLDGAIRFNNGDSNKQAVTVEAGADLWGILSLGMTNPGLVSDSYYNQYGKSKAIEESTPVWIATSDITLPSWCPVGTIVFVVPINSIKVKLANSSNRILAGSGEIVTESEIGRSHAIYIKTDPINMDGTNRNYWVEWYSA